VTLLKPVTIGHGHDKKGFFGWFNRHFSRTAKRYEGWVSRFLDRGGRMAVVYVAIAAVAGLCYARLPMSFLPNEDQGYVIVSTQLPPGATQQRTLDAVKEIETYMLKQPETREIVSILGYSFTGRGQNASIAFAALKDYKERKGEAHSAAAVAARAFAAFSEIRDAIIFPLSPPPIPELGQASGFTFRLQDRGAQGHVALTKARDQLLAAASKSPVITGVRPDGLEDAPQLHLQIDRAKANALGVSYASINTALSTSLGSTYVNDFPNDGRLQRVVVQADAAARMQPADLLRINVVNIEGKAVPLSAFMTTKWDSGAMQMVRYNGYPAMKIAGDAATGRSTGEAMDEMERLARELPKGFTFEWTGQSREERLAGSAAMILYGFAVLAVFLCLAALYESWTIPLAVILVVPLGMMGVILAVLARSMANDVYFQIGLITIIGLSAKNAILIIEFAKDLQAEGRTVVQAALEAAHLRFRPIVMTSLAFTLGVVPLFVASGASSASQRAIGTGVIGGMITGTVLAVVFVPTFFVVVRTFFKGKPRAEELPVQHADAAHFDEGVAHG
jgi:multidrug efflux pump